MHKKKKNILILLFILYTDGGGDESSCLRANLSYNMNKKKFFFFSSSLYLIEKGCVFCLSLSFTHTPNDDDDDALRTYAVCARASRRSSAVVDARAKGEKNNLGSPL